MNRGVWVLLVLLGCAHDPHHKGPDGESLVDVRCTDREACEAEARKLCGGDMMIEHEEDHSRSTSDGAVHEVTMTARCVTVPRPKH